MTDYLKKILLPPNSRRRLFCDLIARAVAQPRDFFRYVNLSSFRYFLNYLRNADPELVGRMVDEVLARDRAQAGEAARINHHFLKVFTGKADTTAPPRLETVDIIIPVYNAFELTQACIASVLEHSDNCRLILVNDASPDARMRPLLETVAGIPERKIEVLVHHNERNLGFVQTVNAAFALTANHFVILNSDTEVPPGWLDRLVAPILADPARVASVTPFSNAGMECSFPKRDRDNPLFRDMSVTELDAFFMRYGGTDPVELFSGVGFCMAFNRKVVERIGLFDAETFGKGYGEEVDWSLRAFDAGYRNMLAPNLFVYHKHGGSFGTEEKTRLMERNQELIWARHGRHMARLREMVSLDSPQVVRDALIMLIDAKRKRNGNRVALIDMDIPGGATLYSSSLRKEMVSAGVEVVHVLYNARQQFLKILLRAEIGENELILPAEATVNIIPLLREFGVCYLVVNELFSWPEPLQIMKNVRLSGLHYMVMIHDFFLVCPSPFLLNRNGRFCSIPENTSACEQCLASNNSSLHREFYGHSLYDLSVWRASVAEFLGEANAVTCFSLSTQGLLLRLYPGLANIIVNEHAIPNRERFIWRERHFDGNGRLNLAIIGHLFPAKGALLVQEMLESPKFRALTVTLTVFGESPLFPPGYRSDDNRVVFTGAYRQEDLPALLEDAGIHAVLITSVCPETFSYTTSEAILMGYPVICFDLGAQAERVRKFGCGVIAESVTAAALMGAIAQLLAAPDKVGELSRNARYYEPATPEKHFNDIVRMLKPDSCSSGPAVLQAEGVR